ncbi:MAG: hypothetical protein M0Q91_16470 [Methanoregula sp.]|jgi:hypothetical protein|nr:hypothetical protein [Methanoregula sp.]
MENMVKKMIEKSVINIGLVAPKKIVILSDGNYEAYVPMHDYSNYRLNQGLTDTEIMDLACE